MLKRASQKLLGAVLLGFLAVSIVIVELHFTGLLPNLFTFLNGVDAKVDLNDGKLTLSRWSSSVFMEVGGRQDVPRATGSVFDGMSLVFSDYEVQVYSLPIDDGGIEYAVILYSNPGKASLDLPFRSANLDFYFQPPLDKELDVSEYDFVNATHAIKDGAVVESRAENVVDSYAVYHQTARGNEYGIGKAFHIYRPQLIDANGAKCWGTLQIADGLLRIGLNQSWLASAAYPVLVDPSFGKTTIGGSSLPGTTDAIYGSFFLGEFGGIDSISVYCNSGTSQKQCAIYNRTGTTTGVSYANTTKKTPTSTGWNTFAINATPTPSIRSQYYYLFVWGYDLNYRYDTISPSSTWRSASRNLTYSDSAVWPSDLTGFTTSSNRIYSIYANYTTPYTYTTTYNVVSNSTVNSSTLISQLTSYPLAWNASSGNNVATYSAGRRRLSSSSYHVRRGFLFFDCLSLGAYGTIISAKLTFNATAITATWANLSATLGVYAPLAGQVNPAVLLPYSAFNYAYYAGGTLLGQNTSGLILNGDNDIVLDPSAINRTAITKLVVRTLNEYANSTSGFSVTTNCEESVTFTNPRLTLTYTIPTAPTVEEPSTYSPYISTTGNLSAIAYADGNLSKVALEDNYTSGVMTTSYLTPPVGAWVLVANFSKAWNASLVTVKWRIWCNDTWNFIGSTEWQYTKIGPQYPAATTYLPCTGVNVTNGTDYTQVGTNKVFYNASNIAVYNLTTPTTGRQLEFLNATSMLATDLRIYEVVGYYANGSTFTPVSVSFASYYASANGPDKTFDNNVATYWDVPGTGFQPARIRWDFNVSRTFSAIGVYTLGTAQCNITVAYINVGNWTGNMTEVGQSPVLGSMDYNSVYPSYLNSSGAARQSDNFTFAPFTLSSSNVWAIDFVMNWSTTNLTWIRVSMYSPLGNFSVDVSPIANASWVVQSVTLSYQNEPCVDVNSTVVSFYSYNSTTVLIDNCSLVVTYNNLNSVDTELNVSTAVAGWDRPLDVLSPVMHALVFSYLNLSDGYYWSIAYDETVLTWTDPISTNVQAPSGGALDPYHFSPSLGLLPNGSLALFVAHETYLTYYITVNSTNTESNLTMILSNWGSVQTISDALYSYLYTVSFSDRLLLFTQHGNVQAGNMTMFTFNATGRYEQTSMIYGKVGETYYGFYGSPNKLANDKLYFSWIAYYIDGHNSHVYSITSSDRGDTWTYLNGTVCTFPLESAQALIVNEDDVWLPTVFDEGDHTSVYYNRVNASYITDPNLTAMHTRYVNGSTVAPNSGITWNSPVSCVDEFGANITGLSNPFYDSSSNKTFLWAQRERFDALTSPYITKYQKTTHNQFFLYLQNTSLLNFMARGALAFEPSVPYEMVGSIQQRSICGYEATGSTQFNLTQGTLYLYPYVATATLNVTHVSIRVNATSDCEIDYLLGHARYYFLYDNNMILMSQGCYGDADSYGDPDAGINTWENIPLDTTNTTGHTYNTGIVTGQTYWIGVIYNNPPNPGPETCGYYKSASATKGRLYTDMGYQYGMINASNVPALANLTDSSYSEESYSLSIFLTSSKIVLYGVWDTLACQSFSMNRTTIAFDTPLAVEFAAQWLDYRGLDQVWFTENSTGSYSTAEYNDTEGASTFWCNRTYTLTITSGLIIDCVMSASNSLGDQTSVHLYILTCAVNLVIGWNNLTTVSLDVGYSLGQVCANIQYDQLNAEVIVYNDGASYTYNYGYAPNLAVNISGSDYSLSIYSLTAGTWYRTYTNFVWKYIQAADVRPYGLNSAAAQREFSWPQSFTLFPANLFGKELKFTSGNTVNVFGNVLRSMELLFTSRQTLSVFGGNLFSKELGFTSGSMVNVFGSTGLGKAFGYLSSGLVNGLGNTVFAKELGFRAFNVASLFGGSSLSKELSFVSGPVVNVFSRVSNGVELAFSQAQTFNVFSSVTSNRGLAFLQGQTLTLFPSLGLGKELGFAPSGTLNVLGYVVPLGPRDLSYALSGLLNVFSSGTMSKELKFMTYPQLSLFSSNVFGRELGFTSSPLFTVYGSGVIGKELVLVSSALVNLFGGGQSNLGRGFTTSQTLTTVAPSNTYQALYENVNTGDDDSLLVYGVYWYAQSFTVTSGHDVVLVRLKLYRVGSPGSFVVGVRAVDESGLPTGEDLSNGTIDGNGFTLDTSGEWANVPVATYSLGVADYAIVVRAAGGGPADFVGWRCIAVGAYGSVKSSGDGGVSWNAYTP